MIKFEFEWNCIEYTFYAVSGSWQTMEQTTMKEYPQVRMTGVDAVHEKLSTEGLYHEEM